MSKIIVARTAPQAEFKAAQEVRDAGHKAYVPTETRYRKHHRQDRNRGARYQVPLAAGYVCASGLPGPSTTWDGHLREPQHVKSRIGETRRNELATLYSNARDVVRQQRIAKAKAAQPIRFDTGTQVRITAGPFEGKSGTVKSMRTKKIAFVIIEGHQISVPTYLCALIETKP